MTYKGPWPGTWATICSSCNIEKDISLFGIHSNGKPRKQCKSCKKNGNPKAPHRVAKQQEWVYKNKDKVSFYVKKWRKANLEYDAFRASCYRARKLQRTPSWASLEKIEKFYLNCPEGFQVDHIIPLKGKKVSGLHILENLQYLPAKENQAKRNKYDV